MNTCVAVCTKSKTIQLRRRQGCLTLPTRISSSIRTIHRWGACTRTSSVQRQRERSQLRHRVRDPYSIISRLFRHCRLSSAHMWSRKELSGRLIPLARNTLNNQWVWYKTRRTISKFKETLIWLKLDCQTLPSTFPKNPKHQEIQWHDPHSIRTLRKPISSRADALLSSSLLVLTAHSWIRILCPKWALSRVVPWISIRQSILYSTRLVALIRRLYHQRCRADPTLSWFTVTLRVKRMLTQGLSRNQQTIFLITDWQINCAEVFRAMCKGCRSVKATEFKFLPKKWRTATFQRLVSAAR